MSDPNSGFQAPPPPPLPAVEPPSGPVLSTGETLTGILFEPSKVFESFRNRPRFLVAGIIMTVALMAYTIVFFQRVGYERVITEAVESGPRAEQMTATQKEQAIRIQTSPIVKAIYYGFPVLIIAIILAAGGGLYLLGSTLMGKKVTYGQAVAVWAYSSMPPLVIAMVLNIILVFIKSPDDYDIVHAQRRGLAQANLAWLVDPKASPVLATALSSLDVFAFYGLFLAALGLRKVGKMSSGTAWTIVLTLWIIGIIIRVALAGIMGNAM